jgi:hypothetical protein
MSGFKKKENVDSKKNKMWIQKRRKCGFKKKENVDSKKKKMWIQKRIKCGFKKEEINVHSNESNLKMCIFYECGLK